MVVDIPTIGNTWLILYYALKESTVRNFSEPALLQTDPNPISYIYEEG